MSNEPICRSSRSLHRCEKPAGHIEAGDEFHRSGDYVWLELMWPWEERLRNEISFDVYVAEHEVTEDEMGAAFGAWLHQRSGWNGGIQRVSEGDEELAEGAEEGSEGVTGALHGTAGHGGRLNGDGADHPQHEQQDKAEEGFPPEGWVEDREHGDSRGDDPERFHPSPDARSE